MASSFFLKKKIYLLSPIVHVHVQDFILFKKKKFGLSSFIK